MNMAHPAATDSLEQILAELQVQAHLIDAGMAVPTAESAAKLLEVPLACVVKTIVMTDEKRFVAVYESFLHFEQVMAGGSKEHLPIQISPSDIAILDDARTATL